MVELLESVRLLQELVSKRVRVTTCFNSNFSVIQHQLGLIHVSKVTWKYRDKLNNWENSVKYEMKYCNIYCKTVIMTVV